MCDWINRRIMYLDKFTFNHRRGDVNGDGRVTVKDLTLLIDYLLSGDDTGIVLGNADVNRKGGVGVSDLTALIDLLLYGGIE